MVFWSSNLSNASAHSVDNLPILIAGGGLRHQGHLAYDRRDNKPLRGPGTVRPVLPQALGGAVPFLLDRPVSASAVCALRGLPRDALDLADRIGLAVDRQQRRRLREIDRTDDALNLFGNRDGIPRAICGGCGQLVLAVR